MGMATGSWCRYARPLSPGFVTRSATVGRLGTFPDGVVGAELEGSLTWDGCRRLVTAQGEGRPMLTKPLLCP